MKKMISVLLVFILIINLLPVALASDTEGKSSTHVFTQLSGSDRKFNGNKYGWYIGNPDSDTVIIVALGSNQDPYDNNALPTYVDSDWKDQNVYWYKPEYTGGRIDMKNGVGTIDAFAELHFNEISKVFPNASSYAVAGYSAGGYTMPSMVKAVQDNGGEVVGIYGFDCVPKDSLYQPFCNMMESASEAGVPTFIATSSQSTSGSKIAPRTAKFIQQHSEWISQVGVYVGAKHGTLCTDPRVKEDVVSGWNQVVSSHVSSGPVLQEYVYTLTDVSDYNPVNRTYVFTYQTLVDGETVTRKETISIDKIGGMTKGLIGTDVGNKFVWEYADRYGTLIGLADNGTTKTENLTVTVKDLVELWDDDAIGSYLQNENVIDFLSLSYRKGLVSEADRSKVYEMLMSTAPNQDGYRVVDLGDNKYLVDNYKDVMSADQVAYMLSKKYLNERTISSTSLEVLDEMWSLGLYDDLSDEARSAYDKRMAELVTGNTYTRSDGTTWTRPGSGYSKIPIDIFTNSVISGMSISKLKAWKTDGIYDGLTAEQKTAVDMRIKMLEVRDTESVQIGWVASITQAIRGIIGSVVSFQKAPQETVTEGMSTARDLLTQYTKDQKEKSVGSDEKSYTIDLGNGPYTVTASSYKEALKKVQSLNMADAEEDVAALDAEFASEAKSYSDAIKLAAQSAAKVVSTVASAVSKVVKPSSATSSSSTNLLTKAVQAVAAVATVITVGIKLISSLTGGHT